MIDDRSRVDIDGMNAPGIGGGANRATLAGIANGVLRG
jgi:hypothetical protein